MLIFRSLYLTDEAVVCQVEGRGFDHMSKCRWKTISRSETSDPAYLNIFCLNSS